MRLLPPLLHAGLSRRTVIGIFQERWRDRHHRTLRCDPFHGQDLLSGVKLVSVASRRSFPPWEQQPPEAMTPESGEVGCEVETSDLLPVVPPENTQPGL